MLKFDSTLLWVVCLCGCATTILAFQNCVNGQQIPKNDHNELDESNRVHRVATEIRQKIGKWLKPNSEVHSYTDAEIMAWFPEMGLPDSQRREKVYGRQGDLVVIMSSPRASMGRGHIFRVEGVPKETTVEIVHERPDSVLGRIVPSENADDVQLGTVLRGTDHQVRHVDWPLAKTSTQFVGEVAGRQAVVSPGVHDHRLKEVLFSIYESENHKLLGVAEIQITAGSGDQLRNGMMVKVAPQYPPLKRHTKVYFVPIPSSAMPPVDVPCQ